MRSIYFSLQGEVNHPTQNLRKHITGGVSSNKSEETPRQQPEIQI